MRIILLLLVLRIAPVVVGQTVLVEMGGVVRTVIASVLVGVAITTPVHIAVTLSGSRSRT
jgi:hypothetical protein